MLLSDHQRQRLGAFIRAHRERLTAAPPAAASHAARRRTPGWRREEVALACGISPTWYAWIEQGRDISVSGPALSRLAAALRLSAPERAYLFELARQRDPALPEDAGRADEDPAASLRAALEAISGPAYLMDPHWRAVAWNIPAGRLFAEWFEREDRCLLGYMFLDARSRRFIPDWEHRARRLVAEFRADTGRGSDDLVLQNLIERLRKTSPAFSALWTDHTVMAREGGPRAFAHPTQGALRYDQITFHPAAWPNHKFVMLVEATGSSEAYTRGR